MGAPNDHSTLIPLVTDSGKPAIEFPLVPTPTYLSTEETTALPTTINQILPTLTPLPALSVEEAQAFVDELLETNHGCDLPCWWGITPGETTWEEAYQFFASFAVEISEPVKEVYIERGEENKINRYNVYLPWRGGNSQFTLGIAVKNELVDVIAQSNSGMQRYFPPYLLIERYGMQKETLLAIEPITPTGKPYYSLVLLFERGIGVHYTGEAEIINNQIEVCPKKVSPRLFLSSKSYSTERMKRMMNVEQLKSVENITGLNKETFYSQLSTQPSCFLTELTIWE
jgi:hypothetical protein